MSVPCVGAADHPASGNLPAHPHLSNLKLLGLVLPRAVP